MVTAKQRRVRRLQAGVLGVLYVLVFALGYWGHALQWQADKVSPVAWHDLVYATLQLFIFEGNAPGVTVPQLWIAQFLAPGVALLSAAAAALTLFADSWHGYRLGRAQGHVVVCGAGQQGETLARGALAEGREVAVIDADGTGAALLALRALGAWIVAGDASDPDVLALARAERAAVLVALCGDDEANVAVGLAAQRAAGELGREGDDPLRIFVQVSDPGLSDVLARQTALAQVPGAPLQVFDAYTMAARRFLSAHPLERGLTGPDDPRCVHLVVLGFGHMGQRLALAALRLGHYANGRPVRVTIVDRDAARVWHGLHWRYPSVEETCDVRVITGDLFDPDVRAQLERGVADELRTYAVCFDADGPAVSAALRLKDLLSRQPDARLAVRLSDSDRFGGLLLGDMPAETDIVILGTHAQAADLSELLDDRLNTQARAVHEAYVRHRRETETSPAGPSMQPWRSLDPDLRDANCQQADHIAVKARAIGAEVVDGPGPELSLSDDEVELLAQMEHRRWVADRLLAGWTAGPRDNAARVHPSLVPWGQVDEATREYDRNAARQLPELLRLAGRHARRSSSGRGDAD